MGWGLHETLVDTNRPRFHRYMYMHEVCINRRHTAVQNMCCKRVRYVRVIVYDSIVGYEGIESTVTTGYQHVCMVWFVLI